MTTKAKYDIERGVSLDRAMELYPVMRFEDCREVWAAGRQTPAEAVETSWECSPETCVGTVDGRVVCVFGVGEWSALSRRGVPWLLTAAELPSHSRRFLRGSREVVTGWREHYELLENHVDARNGHAIRWLGWLGFDIQEARPWGFEGLPFHRFCWDSRESEDVACAA